MALAPQPGARSRGTLPMARATLRRPPFVVVWRLFVSSPPCNCEPSPPMLAHALRMRARMLAVGAGLRLRPAQS